MGKVDVRLDQRNSEHAWYRHRDETRAKDSDRLDDVHHHEERSYGKVRDGRERTKGEEYVLVRTWPQVVISVGETGDCTKEWISGKGRSVLSKFDGWARLG